jgi:hypothetical protein
MPGGRHLHRWRHPLGNDPATNKLERLNGEIERRTNVGWVLLREALSLTAG